ncbi:MAG: PAS-domain containing protein [Pseudomonadota bacterium]|nr:PAS-domain containing protein [Pseudomonadota bacterium]
MTEDPDVVAAIVVIALLWVLVAAALAIIAARRIRSAQHVIDAARRLRALLEAAPVRPLVIRPDGSIDLDPILQRDLGFTEAPTSVDQLGAEGYGLVPGDLELLKTDLKSAMLGARPVRRMVRLASSNRVVEVHGAPALAPEPPGTMLLWFVDISDAEAERATLSRRLGQTESALDALTQLIEAAPFPMWYRGPDLSLGLVNSAFVAAVEARDAAEVIARGTELVDSPGGDSARFGAQRALELGKPYSRNQPATIGEERRMLRLVDVPLSTGAVAGFAVDIQDLEDTRTELARHIESQRELADHMTAGAAQFDQDRRLDFFNQPFALMARLDPEWLAEKPEFDRVLERMREMNRLPEVRDFPAWKAERRDWFIIPDETVEEDWILTSGDHLRVVAQPLPDGGLRLIVEDRTEQVRLASARDTLLRVRSATFDNLFEAISVFASDGRLYLWNRRFCEVWALDETWLGEHPRVDELVPAMARRLVNPTAAAQVRELVRSTTSSRESGSGRVSMTDGRHFEFAAVPLPDGNCLFTMIDVTDSTRIEAALRERATGLEEADRVKTDFVANMSYELRTPLTSIGGFAEMLSGGYAGQLAPAASEYVGAILESVARLSKLIDDVLDLTRGDTSGVVLERERIDLGGLCRSVGESLLGRIADKKQTLEVVIDRSAGIVLGDARRIRESLEHVMRNAVTYTDEGGRVMLRASGDEDEATITVLDNGPGISSEDQAMVFDRFHRALGTGHSDAALGLGLPLTRQFIEAHGGKVELVSAMGEGTAVTLTIPRAP